MNYLVDTNVISEWIAKYPSPQVLEWLTRQESESTYLSAVTIGELQRGIAKMAASPKRDRTFAWLNDQVLPDFAGRILPLDLNTMLVWGKLVAGLEREGATLPLLDSLIAAQALHFNCTLVTRNVRDFERTGVSLLNPWDA